MSPDMILTAQLYPPPCPASPDTVSLVDGGKSHCEKAIAGTPLVRSPALPYSSIPRPGTDLQLLMGPGLHRGGPLLPSPNPSKHIFSDKSHRPSVLKQGDFIMLPVLNGPRECCWNLLRKTPTSCPPWSGGGSFDTAAAHPAWPRSTQPGSPASPQTTPSRWTGR